MVDLLVLNPDWWGGKVHSRPKTSPLRRKQKMFVRTSLKIVEWVYLIVKCNDICDEKLRQVRQILHARNDNWSTIRNRSHTYKHLGQN